MLAPRVGFEPTASRLTAERDKNLSAASGVAYIRLGAILTFLAAPNLAPKSIRNQHTTADALCPTTPFLASDRHGTVSWLNRSYDESSPVILAFDDQLVCTPIVS